MIEASQDVKSTALLELFTQAGSTHPVKATGIGLNEKLVYDIQNLTNREMMRLANTYSSEIVKVVIDVEKLEMLVGNIKYIESETNQAIEFIQRDASTPLLESLFGLGTFEVTAMRKALGISPSGGSVDLHPKVTHFSPIFASNIDPRSTHPAPNDAGAIRSDRRGIIKRNQAVAFP